jgi:hypothetical protein
MTHGRGLLLGVALLALPAVAVVLATSGGSDFKAQAAAVCTGAQGNLEGLPQSPRGAAKALETERPALAIFKREVTELQALGPRASASFRVGLADDRALLALLSSMLARPDFVQLSLKLPGHPELAPPWLKEWLARSHMRQADARRRFSQAGVPACEKSLG